MEQPVLLIAGENAHSRYYSEDAAKAIGDNAEFLMVPDADHVDLYDRADKIPFDRLEDFFKTHLVP
ncbi:alpha/beta hydrolase [Streptococcus ovuberis]|uniref:alpha/beta hydrolase n=1 Tax=Streptococcus ovuberis TaxID=1936207 RepID=UPI001FE9E0A2|nr:alpha/beta hydrolase [Streptococcus ovuberis]